MRRTDLQVLAIVRLKEASQLLRAGCPDGAYYLAGYAVECAIKACIARQTERFEFPDKPRALASWTHDLSDLVKAAKLDSALRAEERLQSDLNANWTIVRQWSERSRYERSDMAKAQGLLDAIKARRFGVLSWLKNHW
jgi:HEPN domain-containing protein